MKQFLQYNTVTYNLMSFTAFKSIIIFSLLLEGPKSYNDIKEVLENHEYLKENVSTDTIRIYLNSLKAFGCDIIKKRCNGSYKFYIENNPFSLNIDDKQAKSIIKVYKAVSKSIDIEDLICLQKFFDKISIYIKNEDLRNKLENLSPLNNIDLNIVKSLISYAKNHNEITVSYNSSKFGKKNITILMDKIYIQNKKLYIAGTNLEYNTYSSFLVSKIYNIVSVNIHSKTLESPELVVRYEYYKDKNEKLELLPNEKIIQTDNEKYIIEITSKNKFDIMQRVLYHCSKCKVLYPQEFKNYIIYTLKRMKEGYIGK